MAGAGAAGLAGAGVLAGAGAVFAAATAGTFLASAGTGLAGEVETPAGRLALPTEDGVLAMMILDDVLMIFASMHQWNPDSPLLQGQAMPSVPPEPGLAP